MTLSPAMLASKRTDWVTPECVLTLVRQLGPIGLDVCTTPDNPVGARRFITHGPGPAAWPRWADWVRLGEVLWMNSPFGRSLPQWISAWAKLGPWVAYEPDGRGVHGLALTPARPDTRWFREAWAASAAVCFWWGRLTFVGAPAPAPFPTAVWYWGPDPWRFCSVFREHGIVQVLR